MSIRCHSALAMLCICVSILNASELEETVHNDVSHYGVQLLQNLVTELQIKAPHAKLTYSNHLLTIEHGSAFNCEKDGMSLWQATKLGRLVFHQCVAKSTTVMRFEPKAIDFAERARLADTIARGRLCKGRIDS